MRIQREKDFEKLEEMRTLFPYYVSEYIQTSLDRLSPTSVLSYALDIKDFLEWVWHSIYPQLTDIKEVSLENLERLIEIDISHYRSYLKNRQELGPKKQNEDVTINRKISALRSLFKYLNENTNRETNRTYLSRNIFENTKHKTTRVTLDAKSKKLETSILQDDEIKEFQEFVNHEYGNLKMTKRTRDMWLFNKERDVAIISLMLGSGMRVGELVSLRLKDLDMNERSVVVDRKRGLTDSIFFPESTRAFLHEYLMIRDIRYRADNHPNSPLFVSRYAGNVNAFSKNAVQKMVMKYGNAFGRDKLTAHCLRHTFGTHVYQKTKDIRTVQEAMGHASVDTTQIYTHVFKNDKRKAIDAAFD